MGHSKWASIELKKGKKDTARGAVFARISREIIVATQLGGPDPAGNFRLRTAIESAKAEGLPNDNIHRAILKGSGALGADRLEEVRYEAYGPGGVALIIEALSNNRNRTAADVRAVLSKLGGNLGEVGSVGWMFKHTGVIALSGTLAEEVLLEATLAANAHSYHLYDTGAEIHTDLAGLEPVSTFFKAQKFNVTQAKMQWIASTSVNLEDLLVAKQVLTLIERLEGLEDVQAVAANYEIPEDLWDQLIEQ